MKRLLRPVAWRMRSLRAWARERRALRRLYAAGVSRQARIFGAERIRLVLDRGKLGKHPFPVVLRKLSTMQIDHTILHV